MAKPKPHHRQKPKQKVKPLAVYSQPPFDIRMRSLSRPILGIHGTKIRRGFMQWDKSTPFPAGYTQAHKGGQAAVVNFLFNPSTVSTSYQIADGAAQAALNYSGSSSNAALLVPLQQQTSFTLMFDRTYEVNDADVIKKYPEIGSWGVDVDVAALRQYTGMYASAYAGNASYYKYTPSNQVQTGNPQNAHGVSIQNNSPLGDLSQGIMQLTLGYVFFGKPGQGIVYYGYIDSWSVEYTHFTQEMVPIRCVVDISFTFLPPPTSKTQKSQTAGAQGISLGQLFSNIEKIAGNKPGPNGGVDVTGIAGR